LRFLCERLPGRGTLSDEGRRLHKGQHNMRHVRKMNVVRENWVLGFVLEPMCRGRQVSDDQIPTYDHDPPDGGSTSIIGLCLDSYIDIRLVHTASISSGPIIIKMLPYAWQWSDKDASMRRPNGDYRPIRAIQLVSNVRPCAA
ncbi:hypothetical protein KCU73_g181, partial [Aureobasidium melanogenum]